MFDINYIELFKSLPPQISIFLISLLPISELRGAIPVGLSVYKLGILETFFWSVLGNILIAFLIIYFLNIIYNNFYGKFGWLDKFFDWLLKRTRKKFSKKYETWGNVALILFVAIPLPMTGAWTASIASWLFGIERKKSLFYISSGVIIAGAIVTFISWSAIGINNHY